MSYIMYHEIDDNPMTNDHLAEIVRSINENGWVGSPLLAIGDQLLNGCHRYTACVLLGVEPEVHQAEIGCTWGDGYDDLLQDLSEACDTFSVLRALKALKEEGLIDDYSVEIIQAECDKE